MMNNTRRALEDFDNQHEFERLAADILNSLGYSSVEPMAPRGGSDGGRDIKFQESATPGVALVTLDKKVRDKFKRDLAKQPDSEGVIAFFCNVDVSPSQKLDFARDAIAKGYRLEVFDLERLRSLLDTSLRDVRRHYLGIDDEAAARIRSEVAKLIRYPDAVGDNTQPPTLLESLLTNKLPRRLFDLLMTYEERDLGEVPGIGQSLRDHLENYYDFRQRTLATEQLLVDRIGQLVSVRIAVAWRIYLKYAIMRFAGASEADIIGWGDFLNYSITWEDAERVFNLLSNEPTFASAMSDVLQFHQRLCETISLVATNSGPDNAV